jgi:subtilisin-like proprotein convertase family protein
MDQPAGGGGHTWIGDLNMTLTSPSASHLIMQRVGSTTGTGSGDSSDFQGPYTFTDGTTGDIWTAAGVIVGGTVPAGAYRTVACCAPVAGPGILTDMNPVFAGPVLHGGSSFSKGKVAQTPTDDVANGVWTLNVSDNAAGDTGRVSALSLTLTTLAPTAALASIRGSVLSGDGQAVSRASVTIFDTNTGESLTATTNQFGYFRFEDLPVGHFYTMTVQHRQHTFLPQSFVLDDDRQADFRSSK